MLPEHNAQDRQRTQGAMPRVYRPARERAKDAGQAVLGFAEDGADAAVWDEVKEAELEREIKDYLSARGIFYVRCQTGMAIAEHQGKRRAIHYHNLGPGCADMMVVLPGSVAGQFKVLWVELKAPQGRQSSAQMKFERVVKARGMEYIVAKSVEDIQVVLAMWF